MLQYFELQEGTSSKFWEISLNANIVKTRYGKIGTQGKTTEKDFQDPVKAQQEYDKLVKEKTGKGYQEVIRDGKTLLPGDYTIISEKEAVKRYKLNKYINGLYDDGSKYMLYQGNVVFNGALDTYKHCTAVKDDIYGIIVEGNLTVKGVIFQPDMDNGEHLLVTGNLHAQSINKGGGEFYIKGDLTAEQTIYGYYNHGQLTVEGKTQAVAIFADDHSFKFMGDVSGTIVGDQEIEGVEDDYNEITVLRPELIKEKEYANSDKISDYINKGKHILRDEFLPAVNDIQVATVPKETVASAKLKVLRLEEANAKVVQQALDKVKDSPKDVQVLDLSDQELDRFPMQLIRLKSLKQLKLNGNNIKTLPAEIAQLANLEELYLSGCELKTLPAELAQLKYLRVLDVSQNNDLELPESINQLAALRVLDVTDCKGLGLTAGIPGLEELRCSACTGASPVDFPKAILECTGLKRLFSNMNSFKQIPPTLTALKELEELYLDSSLCYVNELPDLSGLKKLKILHASGIYNYPESPLPKHSLLKGFFSITSLEELKIDLYRRWLEKLSKETFIEIAGNLQHDPERLKELSDMQAEKVDGGNGKKVGYLRKSLTAAQLEGISALRQLRILDLSENMLSDLPEEIYSLPKLRSLNLKGNSFKISDRLRIAERLPEVELDLRENSAEKEIIDTEAARLWKETADLLEKGDELWFNDAGKPIKAIAIYDKVLANFNNGKVVDKYLLLYTYYVKTNACSNLPMDAAYEKMSKEEKRRYKLLCIETGLTALSLLPEQILHNTSMGAFYREVIRIVANAVAWAMYEVYEDKEKTEEALAIVNKAVACIENESEYYIYDSQVRILLRLGRQEEAWQVVKRTLELDEYFGNFNDITETKEYKKWLKK
ncbi:leucine-rich repeat domain-containing protein [Chitinophaga filiformis]|uniref:WGR domain-containing protein n=1 Tax=Chitinophaga filiformis TaxID=104663 RepID=UPI001F48397F|nr:WGR domain-containing protein [Chitinophaga filiformis]MCF6406828.1 leucine-rich repeat domain-containing protein [Chitinophaga filiformis]